MPSVKVNGKAESTAGWQTFGSFEQGTGYESGAGVLHAKVVEGPSADIPTATVVDAASLYGQDFSTVSGDFGSALTLLREVASKLEAATEQLQKGETFTADDLSYAVKAALPELFCCRGISDGFATIVSGLLAAYSNLDGRALSAAQLRCVADIVRQLYAGPRISLATADSFMDRLEEVGLDPERACLRDLLVAGYEDLSE